MPELTESYLLTLETIREWQKGGKKTAAQPDPVAPNTTAAVLSKAEQAAQQHALTLLMNWKNDAALRARYRGDAKKYLAYEAAMEEAKARRLKKQDGNE
jgi:hypothetical protein